MSDGPRREPIKMRAYKTARPFCEACNEYGTEAHHIKTIGAGGTNEPGNLIALCRLCHAEVHKIGAHTFALKYGLESRFNAALKG